MSAPGSPCKGCLLHEFGCKKGCERWAIYERDKKAWDKVVRNERNRYLGTLNAVIKRKVKEQKQSWRKRKR